MSYKQYLGARYVPLIDGDWDENKVYEPLTVVNYLNNSYTSKKTVPAGTLPTNSTYWALTGNYNAGIGTLTQRVDAIDEDIVAINGAITNIEDVELPDVAAKANSAEISLSGRNFIFIADSYGVLGWTDAVINRLGLTAHALNLGGAGFYAQGGSYTFKSGLENYAGTLSDDEKAAVTDIIVLGGVNDYNETVANIEAAIDAFNAYAKTNFPNARIGCGCLSWMRRDNDVAHYIGKVIPTYQHKFQNTARCYYIPNAYLPMHNYANIDSDGVHPNANGTAAITDWVCNYLMTGDADYIVNNSATVTYAANVSGSLVVNTKMDKTGATLTCNGGVISVPATLMNSQTALHHICRLTGGCFQGHVPVVGLTGMASATATVTATVATNAVTYTVPLALSFYDGYIDYSGAVIEEAGGAYNTFATIYQINIPPFTVRAGLLET